MSPVSNPRLKSIKILCFFKSMGRPDSREAKLENAFINRQFDATRTTFSHEINVIFWKPKSGRKPRTVVTLFQVQEIAGLVETIALKSVFF